MTLVRKYFLPGCSYALNTFLPNQLLSCLVPCLTVFPTNCVSFPNVKRISYRNLSTKSKEVENLHEENEVISKQRSSKNKIKSIGSRKETVPNDILQYFILNKIEGTLDRIPKRLLSIKRKPPEVRYIFCEKVAHALVDAIREDLLQNESPIFEANPGLGFISKKLLDFPATRIQLFEPSSDFRLQLSNFVKDNADRISMTDFNLFTIAKIVFQDKIDNGTRLNTLFNDLPRKDWTAEPAARIIGILPSLNFVKHLMLSLIFQSGIMTFGRPELYLIMEPLLYTHLTCDGKAGYMLYRTSSVLFQLIFHYKILAKLPKNAIFPWYTSVSKKRSTIAKMQSVDAEWVYVVKCSPKQDFYDSVVPPEQLQPLWYFVRHHLTSRNNRVIPQLEQWIPGCGPRIIAKGMNIFSKFGDLSPQEMLSLFHDFISWPEYPACPFVASVEHAYLKMEPCSDDLDDAPVKRKSVQEVEDETVAEVMSIDTDHKS